MNLSIDVAPKKSPVAGQVMGLTVHIENEADKQLARVVLQNDWIEVNGTKFYPRHPTKVEGEEKIPSALHFVNSELTSLKG